MTSSAPNKASTKDELLVGPSPSPLPQRACNGLEVEVFPVDWNKDKKGQEGRRGRRAGLQRALLMLNALSKLVITFSPFRKPNNNRHVRGRSCEDIVVKTDLRAHTPKKVGSCSEPNTFLDFCTCIMYLYYEHCG